MKTYRGTIEDGKPLVTVDHAPLPLPPAFAGISATGFAWGIAAGDGARQLALAIAADHLADPDEAEAVYKPIEHMLLHECAAGDPWLLTALEISRAIDELDLGR